MDDKQTVCLTLYCPIQHGDAVKEVLSIKSINYTNLLAQGAWHHLREASWVFHFVMQYADADWLADKLHCLLTERGEQEVLLTLHPVTIWSKQ